MPAGDLQWQLYDLLGHRNEWWVPGKLVELRQRLESYWRVRNTPSHCCVYQSLQCCAMHAEPCRSMLCCLLSQCCCCAMLCCAVLLVLSCAMLCAVLLLLYTGILSMTLLSVLMCSVPYCATVLLCCIDGVNIDCVSVVLGFVLRFSTSCSEACIAECMQAPSSVDTLQMHRAAKPWKDKTCSTP